MPRRGRWLKVPRMVRRPQRQVGLEPAVPVKLAAEHGAAQHHPVGAEQVILAGQTGTFNVFDDPRATPRDEAVMWVRSGRDRWRRDRAGKQSS